MFAIVSLVPFKSFGPFSQVSFVVEALAPLGRSFIAHFNFFLVLLTYMLQRAHTRVARVCGFAAYAPLLSRAGHGIASRRRWALVQSSLYL